MARLLSDTLADTILPEAALAELERLNEEAAPLHIWLRTRATSPCAAWRGFPALRTTPRASACVEMG
jgi:hypothetical protein